MAKYMLICSVMFLYYGSLLHAVLAEPRNQEDRQDIRLQDHGDGTMTDTIRNLEWIPRLRIEARSLEEAILFSSRLEYASHDDWRLPSKSELVDLITCLPSDHDSKKYSAVAKAKSGRMTRFWTSTLYAQDAKKQGGFVLQSSKPFVETVTPSGGVIIHGGAESTGVYLLVVRDIRSDSTPSKTETTVPNSVRD